MNYAKVYGAQVSMLTPHLVSVETDVARGMPSFAIVGLPDAAVQEARDRIASAVRHTGFDSPKSGPKKIVISLAPADLKKEGPLFDLALALSYLLAMDEIRFDPEPYLFVGELSLDGMLRPVRGILPLVAHAKKLGKRAVFVPKENEREAALVAGIEVYGAENLRQVVEHLDEKNKSRSDLDFAEYRGPTLVETSGDSESDAPRTVLQHQSQGRSSRRFRLTPAPHTELSGAAPESLFAFEDIRGQFAAKRAAIIAAAGGHNLGLSGPPGTGKTMLARAIAAILPPLTFDEALEVNGIHSVAGALGGELMMTPPMRSPHHTSSYVSIVGGGANPRPGEATLAHRGVLFLDEFPEFDRRVIEALRQPLEDRLISISRSKGSASFPARFILIAAMNPCPCGNWGHPKLACTCAPHALERYRRKISGPIADRVDLWSTMGPVELAELNTRAKENSETLAARDAVLRARAMQAERSKNIKPSVSSNKLSAALRLNSDLSPREIDELVALDAPARTTLEQAGTRFNLSPRSYHRMLKVARTIADLEGSDTLEPAHVLEALQYRRAEK